MSFNNSWGETVFEAWLWNTSSSSELLRLFTKLPPRVSFWKAAQCNADDREWSAVQCNADDMSDPACYSLRISRGRKCTQTILPPSRIITGLYCWWYLLPSSAMPHWSTICMPLLSANLHRNGPGMPRIKRKPWLVISLQPLLGSHISSFEVGATGNVSSAAAIKWATLH